MGSLLVEERGGRGLRHTAEQFLLQMHLVGFIWSLDCIIGQLVTAFKLGLGASFPRFPFLQISLNPRGQFCPNLIASLQSESKAGFSKRLRC